PHTRRVLEHQDRRAHHDLLALAEQALAQLAPAYADAVLAPEVAHAHAVDLDAQLGVLARRVRVVEADLTGLVAPDEDARGRLRQDEARALLRPVHDREGRGELRLTGAARLAQELARERAGALGRGRLRDRDARAHDDLEAADVDAVSVAQRLRAAGDEPR